MMPQETTMILGQAAVETMDIRLKETNFCLFLK